MWRDGSPLRWLLGLRGGLVVCIWGGGVGGGRGMGFWVGIECMVVVVVVVGLRWVVGMSFCIVVEGVEGGNGCVGFGVVGIV